MLPFRGTSKAQRNEKQKSHVVQQNEIESAAKE